MRPDDLLPPPPMPTDRPVPSRSRRRPRRDRLDRSPHGHDRSGERHASRGAASRWGPGHRPRLAAHPGAVAAVTLALGVGTVTAVVSGVTGSPLEIGTAAGADGRDVSSTSHGGALGLRSESVTTGSTVTTRRDAVGPDPIGPDPDAGVLAAGTAVHPSGEVQRLAEQRELPRLTVGDADPGDRVGAAEEPAPEPAPEPAAYVAADGEVVDAERIFAFLDGRGAPLAEHAETIVSAGITHDVDPRVVVAIAIAESNGAKMKPAGTHNAWGWGGSGGPRGLRSWDSWEESIDQYTERLGVLYDTDNVDWEFASIYCPPNTRWWLDTVTWAIGAI